MERPKIKDYYWKDATLNEVTETYNKAPELFKYTQAVDRYADALEDSLAKDGESLTLMNIELKGLRGELSERQTSTEANKTPGTKQLNIADVSNSVCKRFGKCGFAISNYLECYKDCKHFEQTDC